MQHFKAGEIPEYVLSPLSDVGKEQVRLCDAIHTDTGTVFYQQHYDHVMIVIIHGSGTKACLGIRKQIATMPVYFLGHTPQVIEWGKKYCEEVGTLFRLKEFGHG